MCNMPEANNRPIAHSATDRAPAQLYVDHVKNVIDMALGHLSRMLRYYNGSIDPLVLTEIVRECSRFHDLGKLMDICQAILRGDATGKMFNHVDPGVAHIISEISQIRSPAIRDMFLIIAAMIEGHHIGLIEQNKKGKTKLFSAFARQHERFLRDDRPASIYGLSKNRTVEDVTNSKIVELLQRHNHECDGHQPTDDIDSGGVRIKDISALTIRLLMSAFADADHSDTTKAKGYFASDPEDKRYELRPSERLENLIAYVNKKPQEEKSKDRAVINRNKLRTKLFQDCLNTPITDKIFLIDAPVGLGKTLSSMALALRLCIHNGCRRIIHVSPFINIITQVANEFTKSCSLSDQDNLDIAVHHHVYDFTSYVSKASTVSWNSPIICTTAVQMIESLCSNKPVVLKKIRNIPGSVIVLDEYDNMMPFHLWQQFALLLSDLVQNWGCSVIYASGTPVDFWSIGKMKCQTIRPTCNPASVATKKLWHVAEERRIKMKHKKTPMTGDKFLDFVFKHRGSKLVITNTIRNTALLAHFARLQKRLPAKDIYHLSHALIVKEREKNLDDIKTALLADKNNNEKKKKKKREIVVFATSIVESGVDISFKYVFTEARSMSAAMQPAGRGNRNNEFRYKHSRYTGSIYIFRLNPDNKFPFTKHPVFEDHQDILLQMLKSRSIMRQRDCTTAIERYLEKHSIETKQHIIKEAEEEKNFGTVKKECRVIQDLHIPVLAADDPSDSTPKTGADLSGHDLFHQLLRTDTEGLKECGLLNASDVFKALSRNSFSFSLRSVVPAIKLDECIDDWDTDWPILGKIRPGDVLLWNGGYENLFLGYMNEVLFNMGIEGVVRAQNPAERLKFAAKDVFDRIHSQIGTSTRTIKVDKTKYFYHINHPDNED